MKIEDFMSQPVTVVSEDTTLEEIARTLLDQHIGCAPVVDARGRISGIITESDFAAKEKGVPFSTFRAPQLFGQWMGKEGVEELYRTAQTMPAQTIMTRRVVTVTEDEPVEAVIQKMLSHDINRIPVVRQGVPVGIVTVVLGGIYLLVLMHRRAPY